MRTFTACATAPATVATVVITTAISISVCVSWNTRYKETKESVIDVYIDYSFPFTLKGKIYARGAQNKKCVFTKDYFV